MEIISQIREGMTVVAANGDPVGKVDDLKIGDPAAVTAVGQTKGDTSNLWTAVVENISGSEPSVPDEQHDRMLRLGYIRVDAKGLFSGHFYVAADSIDRVADDEVHLTFTPER